MSRCENESDKQLTIMGMRHNEEPVALQAIEFWATVCEEEIELTLDAEEVSPKLRIHLTAGTLVRRNT